MSTTLVQIQVEEKRFRAHQVIDRLALDIRAGEIVSLVGPRCCASSPG
jgi:ABC-type Fe3+/spermidine/putrescine transport system ATPase subunit